MRSATSQGKAVTRGAHGEARPAAHAWPDISERSLTRSVARTPTCSTLRNFRVGILTLVTNGPTRARYPRRRRANRTSNMPQGLAVWCERLGRAGRRVVDTAFEDLAAELPRHVDVRRIGACRATAPLAYTISNR